LSQNVAVKTIFVVIRKELEAIAAEYPDRFKVWYTLDRPGSGNASVFCCYPFQSSVSSPSGIAKHVACNLLKIPHAVLQPALIFKQIHFLLVGTMTFFREVLTGKGLFSATGE
jgi:hypothetical protein